MKIGFVSLGCPKNLVDGEVMLGIARDAGHELTTDAASADVLVVNTCAFIDSAKQESIDAILEMAQQKKDGRCSRLVVTGCLGERYREQLQREIPEIDAVLGTGDVERVVEAIEGEHETSIGARPSAPRGSETALGADPGIGSDPERSWTQGRDHVRPLAFHRKRGTAVAALVAGLPGADAADRVPGREHRVPDHDATAERRAPLPTYLYDADTPRLLTTPKHFAYVKIAEGCDYTCAFCIIPTLRGKFRSRDAASIVREARSLAERGVKELLLISQDTTFYGIDKGERGALARLLRELDRIDGLSWIRLLYLYPTTITDDVLAAMAECEKVCNYIDLPLQHAAGSVLKRMRRPGDRRTYDKLLARIRHTVPDVTLRTTLIVGFPGETDAEFEQLESFVADTAFDHVGVFTYSHEEGTRAFALPDDVPPRLKRARRNSLMRRQKKIVAAAQRRKRGQEVEVLVDGPSTEHELVLQGRLRGQAPEIDPVVFLTDCDPETVRAGDLIHARIVGARDYDLIAAPRT